jgi:uncharacterized membrane protein YfcA
MEILGYAAALLIGLSLGLIGGGGSILTVPVLVYLFALEPVMATAYSLFIVGTTSLAGSYSYYAKGLVSVKTAIVFGIPSMVAVFLTRKYVVPAIPEHILSIGHIAITKGVLLMVIFALLMIFASISMIRKCKGDDCPDQDNTDKPQVFNYPAILGEGTVVGVLTGLVGAGGGFLIIPALVLFSKLRMKLAVGTSLVIIAAKSLFGFLGDVANYTINWPFLLVFTAISIIGIFAGSALSRKIPGERLKTGFGWFVLVMGIYIFVKELFLQP